jgi:hypothetical protein
MGRNATAPVLRLRLVTFIAMTEKDLAFLVDTWFRCAPRGHIGECNWGHSQGARAHPKQSRKFWQVLVAGPGHAIQLLDTVAVPPKKQR